MPHANALNARRECRIEETSRATAGITIALLFISGVSRKPRISHPNENGRLHRAESFSSKRFLDRSDQVESGVAGIHGQEWHDAWTMLVGPPDRLHPNILRRLWDR